MSDGAHFCIIYAKSKLINMKHHKQYLFEFPDPPARVGNPLSQAVPIILYLEFQYLVTKGIRRIPEPGFLAFISIAIADLENGNLSRKI